MAASNLEKIRLASAAATSAAPAISLTGSSTPATTNTVNDTTTRALIDAQTVSPARTLTPDQVIPGGNLVVNLRNALANQSSPDNLVLRDGDVITVPEKPTTVAITGAVIRPNVVLFSPGLTVAKAVAFSGGYTRDAAADQVYVIHPNGQIAKAKGNTRLQLGDVVFVPTKIEVTKLTDNAAVLDRTIGQITNAGILYGVIRSLSK